LLNVAAVVNEPMPSLIVKIPPNSSRSKPPKYALPSVNAML
jgi:hypothetical protein